MNIFSDVVEPDPEWTYEDYESDESYEASDVDQPSNRRCSVPTAVS